MKERVSFRWVKEKFFSDPDKLLKVKAGEVLLEHNQINQKLYLVLEGKMVGYLVDSGLEAYPILEATADKFIGVYSYFSDDKKSYSRVIAAEDSLVCYYDKALQDHTSEEWNKLAPFLISVVVNELFARQHFARQMAVEKSNDVQRLLKAEKMATLGQMAAGLAHELNNAIGVLSGGVDHMATFYSRWVSANNDPKLLEVFTEGLERGQHLSSEEARSHRKLFEKIKALSETQKRKLAKTGLKYALVENYLKKNPNNADKLFSCWEAGSTIHDMQIAARHSSHVVRSVKQLGVTEHVWSKNINVNDTINEALVILKNMTKRVKTSYQLDDQLPVTEGCVGQLIQVWINLVKNGIESMLGANVDEPEIEIISEHTPSQIRVRIIDNGPGIEQDIMNKIFQPSFTTKVGGLSFGLGLGLSIVQRIITEHGGSIEVSSKPGNTQFMVQLPIIN